MASKFKIGDEVIQVLPQPIKGTILKRKIDGDDDLFLVEWVEDEDQHFRWFNENDIISA